MMKTLLLSLLISLPLSAQIRTGGGAVEEDKNREVMSPDEGGSAPSEISKEIRQYTSHLKDREKECRSQGMRYLDIDPDFMQVYLKLSVLKTSFVADNKCEDSKAYFKCLSDKVAQEKIKKLATDRRTLQYLKENYGLNRKEAKGLLQFFQELHKGCPGENCQQ
jgi:hypothetical protein